MKIESTLEKIGFSPNEIKVYLTLNKNGSTKAGKIAKIAKIDRSSAYNSLKILQEKGLVSYVNIGKVKWFQVTGPRRILEYLQEQEEDVKEILPQLQEMHEIKKVEGQVRLFKGLKGVRTVFLDIIRKGRIEIDHKTSENKYAPGITESPAVTNIYGDKIAIIIWTDEPEAIIIENSFAAKAYKSYFDFMWEHGKKI